MFHSTDLPRCWHKFGPYLLRVLKPPSKWSLINLDDPTAGITWRPPCMLAKLLSGEGHKQHVRVLSFWIVTDTYSHVCVCVCGGNTAMNCRHKVRLLIFSHTLWQSSYPKILLGRVLRSRKRWSSRQVSHVCSMHQMWSMFPNRWSLNLVIYHDSSWEAKSSKKGGSITILVISCRTPRKPKMSGTPPTEWTRSSWDLSRWGLP